MKMRLYFIRDILNRFAPKDNMLKNRWVQDIEHSRVYYSIVGAQATSTYLNNRGLSTEVVYIEFDENDIKTV